MASVTEIHPDQYWPIDRPTLVVELLLMYDFNETGFLHRDSFRPIAQLAGLATEMTDTHWSEMFSRFCGEFKFNEEQGNPYRVDQAVAQQKEMWRLQFQ